ncbi:hypothetical protein M0R88_07790 [Halorussus gelatinilyticus]|uniref:Uncharacterized protein n=1 Tax=Halorussus gelatinilyticus TaxID=2937524 RepID=A0A8U0IN27_9EURY|nr:hypothetical protein [Halorussus gelatinilyticus]UPW01986.1 hypothetical protein M0R88_07790 [Halorussus gelatinilyticus]
MEMQKIDALTLLGLLVGGLLSLGDGKLLGVPLLVASAYLLAERRTRPTERRLTTRLTAAIGALAR